jgi:membrane AbrB-like protein
LVAFAISGCYAGLRFDKDAVLGCVRLIPAMLAGIALLIVSCVALIWAIRYSFAGISPLTAFLSIMPGGIDAATAVAYGAHASMPVIVLIQVTRLVIVNLLAPQMARLAARCCVKS